MLRIKEGTTPGENRTWWQCPGCKVRDAYFLRQPYNCPECEMILPAFNLLYSTEQARVLFFRVANNIKSSKRKVK